MPSSIDRRQFLAAAAAATAASGTSASAATTTFDRPNSLYHGDEWESLNPGYWQIHDGALRRRIHNYGDRARKTGFPYHYETHGDRLGTYEMPVEYDPSLPPGVLWHRNWKMRGNYKLRIEGRIVATAHGPRDGDDPNWQIYQPGYGLFGLAFGSQTLFQSFGQASRGRAAAWFAAWRDDGQFGVYEHGSTRKQGATPVPRPAADDEFVITLEVSGDESRPASVLAALSLPGRNATYRVLTGELDRETTSDGYVGLVSQGLLDFEIHSFTVEAPAASALEPAINECHACYALGDTLREKDGAWQARFVALFRRDGERAQLRIADTQSPRDGWAAVPVAAEAAIVNNDFRRNTAILDAKLPASPADTTLYYTVWKDGVNVTTDPRLGTDAVGPGTGLVGQVPASGDYVGRLPRLEAPYKLCGLSCHAIHGGNPNLPGDRPGEGFFVHDQPTPGAYQHLDDYDFQVMLWEDDVWYMELLLYPPSPDDAYKIVTTTLCGPTARWQMMRHWNVINPGDHDYGMDDVKGPEQIAIRNEVDLGQDRDYMRRNFQIVHHLVTGDDAPSATENPKKWRRWKMPNRDFSLLVLDSRLWRSSQDTNIWDDEGWGGKESLYSRRDVTRSLLGEEQFGWLQETIRTDSSPLICLTGINGMHTIWTGDRRKPESAMRLYERDRVAADYAGWVSAGVDRILELLGSRDGIVSVYGDVHVGLILRNTQHRLYEASFGPIGRSGGRGVKDGFGPNMRDFDGREVEITALYHQSYDNPQLEKKDGPFYWNFLEIALDPRGSSPTVQLRVRNLVDRPSDDPRGGGSVAENARDMGRAISCRLPNITLPPHADVQITTSDGRPVRGARTLADGTLPVDGLVDVSPGVSVMASARRGDKVVGLVVTTQPL